MLFGRGIVRRVYSYRPCSLLTTILYNCWIVVLQEMKMVAAALFPSLLIAAAKKGDVKLMKDLYEQVSHSQRFLSSCPLQYMLHLLPIREHDFVTKSILGIFWYCLCGYKTVSPTWKNLRTKACLMHPSASRDCTVLPEGHFPRVTLYLLHSTVYQAGAPSLGMTLRIEWCWYVWLSVFPNRAQTPTARTTMRDLHYMWPVPRVIWKSCASCCNTAPPSTREIDLVACQYRMLYLEGKICSCTTILSPVAASF